MASDDEPAGESGDPGVGHSEGVADGDGPSGEESDEGRAPVGGPEGGRPPVGRPDGGRPPVGRDEEESPAPGRDGAGTPEDRSVYDAEHALEWLQRARGHLLAFHHAVGHAMDKLADAEDDLRAAGHDDLADRVRDDLLPAGVTDRDAWSYEVVEQFEGGPLADAEEFEAEVRERLVGGERHVAERAQQERWRERAEE